jgi:hypothetical protein
VRLAPLGELSTRHAAAFRFRAVGERVLITNQEGRWLTLTAAEFDAFTRDQVAADSELHARLRSHQLPARSLRRARRRRRWCARASGSCTTAPTCTWR